MTEVSQRLTRLLLALLLALSCPAALGDELSLQRLREEGELTEAQQRELDEVEVWLRERREAIAARRSEAGWRSARELRAEVEAELRRRVEAAVEAERAGLFDSASALPPVLPPWVTGVELQLSQAFHAGFDGDPGSIAARSESVTASLTWLPEPELALSLSLGLTQTRYDIDGAFELDPVEGELVGLVTSPRSSLTLRWRPAERWTLLTSLRLSASAEAGVDLRDGFIFGDIAALSYDLSPSLSLGGGLLINSQLEDDPRILPLPLIRWRIELSEAWQLRFGLPEGLQLRYEPRKDLFATIGVGFGGALGVQDLRLNDRGFAPDGILRQQLIPLAARLTWKPWPFLELSLDGGLNLYRELEVDDARGRSLTDSRARPAPTAGLHIKLQF